MIDLVGSYVDFGDTDVSAFRTLRILRALRPLRAVSRWQNMKVRHFTDQCCLKSQRQMFCLEITLI